MKKISRSTLLQLEKRMQLFSGFAVIWLLGIMVATSAEIVMNYGRLSLTDERPLLIFYKILNTLKYWMEGYALLLIVFLAASYFSARIAMRIVIAFMLLLLLIQVLLIT